MIGATVPVPAFRRLLDIPSRTRHLDLGCAPEVVLRASGAQEHQFLDVRMASHWAELEGLLAEQGITYRVK